jgi:nicotinamide mononucleotide adenylyltransferase
MPSSEAMTMVLIILGSQRLNYHILNDMTETKDLSMIAELAI